MAEPIPLQVPEGSPEPRIRIVRHFVKPFNTVLTTARTCYSSKGLIEDSDLKPGGEGLARDLYEAGHHTTIQHAYFQFAMENVSRQFLWSFLHAHPFYNSEQVSQRYVKVRKSNCFVPPLTGDARAIYLEGVEQQLAFYRELNQVLLPLAETAYFQRFPARRGKDGYAKEIEKKAQEIARYVLPIATCAYLYHTVSALTILRYWRMCEHADVPYEQKLVVGKMVEALLAIDPEYRRLLEEPVPVEETPEAAFFAARPELASRTVRSEFIAEFDASLGGRMSKLVDWKARAEEETARAVREVLGVPSSRMTDDEAIALACDPSRNATLGQALNVTTFDKLTRAMHHPAYTFRKKISHAGDSQDQRHRMTPASRPMLAAHATGEPDYAVPALVRQDPKVERRYREMMVRVWERIGALQSMGVSDEFALYLLPNAVNVRYTESTDFLNLRHKHVMRLCYLAQEEIWQASVDEAEQVRAVHPRLGAQLLPPCGVRKEAGTKPFCPEGARFCGVPVWNLALEDYRRVI
ncbi:MAG TPA: FAD-dependent thymidylate synthase [Candidatus Polarisedimenticolaceae bacterium]|nr:FAD-dependent thymidylate synthase [Candidatus Polarisedimenticolaceae bacterium]